MDYVILLTMIYGHYIQNTLKPELKMNIPNATDWFKIASNQSPLSSLQLWKFINHYNIDIDLKLNKNNIWKSKLIKFQGSKTAYDTEKTQCWYDIKSYFKSKYLERKENLQREISVLKDLSKTKVIRQSYKVTL